ncbi:hypothetical protein FIBSPDRAFT_949450 [Athelia psychrophila]|uniref:RNA polymerase II-associated protein 3 n=1 Tax=Athelia psychrophila TaxID=1759441 RepID=A0A166PNE9_9AGAM|nr:hypothetical protein FIBSPDRAFT_949450 [Fibularhizoctonia sp. CBS 109695]
MASTKAQLAKEKGNTAFKAGDYPTAIGFYSEAIIADRADATFPLNRAAAYLKLGKNEDAERDCTTVLALSQTNVKGLFRRAQARIAMGKLLDAQDDLKQALKIESGNEAVKKELTNVEGMLSKAKGKKPARTVLDPTAFPSTLQPVSPKRRRIPITIVEPNSPSSATAKGKAKSKANATKTPSLPSTSADDLMKPISSRPLTSASEGKTTTPVAATSLRTVSATDVKAVLQGESTPTPISTPAVSVSAPKPSSFKEAKQVRESSKPSRAGGGIFRPSGEHVAYDKGEKLNPAALSSATTHDVTAAEASVTPAPVAKAKPPMSLFDFTRAWESLLPDEVREKWALLSTIPPQALPALFQTSLEPPLLVSILATFQSKIKLDPAAASAETAMKDRAHMREYMAAFARVPRFSFVVMFMSTSEKEVAKDVWEGLGVRNGGAAWGLK